MPLLDHHRPPLFPLLTWPSVHTMWLGTLAADLTRQLPKPYYWAAPSRHLGIEVDVAALERGRDPDGNGLAWVPKWLPPPAKATVPFGPAADEQEVRIIERGSVDGVRLVAAVEVVSPANKDRPDHRAAFVSKCHALLQKGIGVMIVDTVTDKLFNLHNDLMDRVGSPAERVDGHLYATAYRATGKNGDGELAVWAEPLAVGQPLPTLPLWLLGGICVPARLEETYDRACRELEVDALLGLPAREPARPGPNGAAP